jgi:hypothetical protein
VYLCEETFNDEPRKELLNGEIFEVIMETELGTEAWKRHFDTIMPQSSLRWCVPAPDAIIPRQVANA